MTDTKIDIIAGLGFSDEGKGKVCKQIAKDYDVVMRVNGSWSSSHQIDEINYCFHLPTTLDADIIVGSGMYVNPTILLEELKSPLRQHQNIYISEDCPVIMQSGEVDKTLGTLGSGVRQACIDRLNHKGKVLKNVIDYYPELIPYIITDDQYFELTFGKKILVEGSHGYFIDINFGHYPETTSTNTTPGSIMGLTKYDPRFLNNVIFVAGLIVPSLGIHSKHRKFAEFGLEHLVDLIPENIKIDKACGRPTARNFGPLDIDEFRKVIRYYPKCKIIFNFLDIVIKMKKFYYIENDTLHELTPTKNFYNDIFTLLSEKFGRDIFISTWENCDDADSIKSFSDFINAC